MDPVAFLIQQYSGSTWLRSLVYLAFVQKRPYTYAFQDLQASTATATHVQDRFREIEGNVAFVSPYRHAMRLLEI